MAWFDLLKRRPRGRDDVALDIDLEVGVLERCPVCREVFDRQHDDRIAEAEKLARQRFAAGDPAIRAAYGEDIDDLCRRLDTVRERFEYDCLCQDMG